MLRCSTTGIELLAAKCKVSHYDTIVNTQWLRLGGLLHRGLINKQFGTRHTLSCRNASIAFDRKPSACLQPSLCTH